MPKITKKGQVTIPKKYREQLGLKPGEEVEFENKDGEIELKKKKKRLDKWEGFLGQGTTEKVMEELRGKR